MAALSIEERGPLWKVSAGDTFTLRYIHSMYGVEVREHFRLDQEDFTLYHVDSSEAALEYFGSVPAARRGYKEVNLRAIQVLRPGGLLVTASCSYHLSEALFEEILLDASNDAARPLQILERRSAGRDHPVLLGVPETRYLKLLVARVP